MLLRIYHRILQLVHFFLLPVEDFTDRWVQSKAKSDYGKFSLSAGEFYGDSELDKGKWVLSA